MRFNFFIPSSLTLSDEFVQLYYEALFNFDENLDRESIIIQAMGMIPNARTYIAKLFSSTKNNWLALTTVMIDKNDRIFENIYSRNIRLLDMIHSALIAFGLT
tara:strand:+ start:244 stop:552 length:309 start_codon:yes stop_codon:yes gene_type:complete